MSDKITRRAWDYEFKSPNKIDFKWHYGRSSRLYEHYLWIDFDIFKDRWKKILNVWDSVILRSELCPQGLDMYTIDLHPKRNWSALNYSIEYESGIKDIEREFISKYFDYKHLEDTGFCIYSPRKKLEELLVLNEWSFISEEVKKEIISIFKVSEYSKYVQWCVENMPFEDDSFDEILSLYSVPVYSVDDFSALLAIYEMIRVCRIWWEVIIAPFSNSWIFNKDWSIYFIWAWWAHFLLTKVNYKELFEKAGVEFNVQKIWNKFTDYTFWRIKIKKTKHTDLWVIKDELDRLYKSQND